MGKGAGFEGNGFDPNWDDTKGVFEAKGFSSVPGENVAPDAKSGGLVKGGSCGGNSGKGSNGIKESRSSGVDDGVGLVSVVSFDSADDLVSVVGFDSVVDLSSVDAGSS